MVDSAHGGACPGGGPSAASCDGLVDDAFAVHVYTYRNNRGRDVGYRAVSGRQWLDLDTEDHMQCTKTYSIRR